MTQVSLADAKARLSALLDRVEQGETVTITRRGKAVAQLSRAEQDVKRAIDPAALRAVTETLPRADQGAAPLLREMRERSRY